MPARTGGRSLKPRRARRGAVARAGGEAIDRPIALGRRTARMRRIDGLGVAAEMIENSRNDGATRRAPLGGPS